MLQAGLLAVEARATTVAAPRSDTRIWPTDALEATCDRVKGLCYLYLVTSLVCCSARLCCSKEIEKLQDARYWTRSMCSWSGRSRILFALLRALWSCSGSERLLGWGGEVSRSNGVPVEALGSTVESCTPLY